MLKFDDDRWRTVSLKNQIFILCPGQQTHLLQISSNIPAILSSCSRLFATENTHFARNVIFGHVSAKNSWLLIFRLRQVIVVLINVYWRLRLRTSFYFSFAAVQETR
jgi:hypothetical protein